MRKATQDMMFVHHVLPFGTAAMLAQKPYVVFLHGMDFWTAEQRLFKCWLMRRVLRHAHTVVVNTFSLKHHVETLIGRRDVMVCYPQPWIVGSPHTHTNRTRVELVSVSRLVERKGIQRVLNVLASDAVLRASCHYMIVGEGDFGETLKRMIAEKQLASCVTLTESSSPEVWKSAYDNADIFVLPTIQREGDREGFGMVYLEAATFGVPSIASRVEGVDEAVIDKETGLLVGDDDELRRALHALIEDTHMRERLGQQAYAHVQTFLHRERIFAPLKARFGL